MNFNLDALKGLSSKVTPFAQRAQQFVSEQVSNVPKTELPEEYLDLEKKVDALKGAHVKLLAVTQTYSRENYDYPTNLRETGAELFTSISQKANDLAAAQSTAEAQTAITKPAPKGAPKTLSHALGRAAMSGAEGLGVTHSTDNTLGAALQTVALASEQVGEARLAQDSRINSEVNAGLSTTLNTTLQFATRARKTVYSTRLSLDAAKTAAKNARPDKADAARIEVERAEDEFVAAVEEATTVMKSCLESAEPLRNLQDLVAAQAAFHKRAAEILEEAAAAIKQT
ncbi:BAR domain-containing family protein [Protomyces lactucae-debilis]|uniref:BAR domain-containing family protein n=1 Tax=Protomyces lactucae-debilis TaxID=2754530 RepID=A0A1Y2FG75_PROLT|nr:BAR domain-containing family protein [Protomyces lactucae-debilis]ORY82617.1 BAR domain-containing family protein [Protomyces lactucae-debilis]